MMYFWIILGALMAFCVLMTVVDAAFGLNKPKKKVSRRKGRNYGTLAEDDFDYFW